MKLTALELVRIIVTLERYDECDEDYIEDLQVKIAKMCLPKEISLEEMVKMRRGSE